MKKICVLALLLMTALSAFPQKNRIYEDKDMHEVILKGMDHMYNFEFDQAEGYYQKVKSKYPESPAYNILMAMNLYWEMMEENNFEDLRDDYLNYLFEAVEQAEEMDEESEEAWFFESTARCYIAVYYSLIGETMDCVSQGVKAYNIMKKGFKAKERYEEFYFASGLYNYFVEKYPENNPIYKPFLWMFRSGDKEQGIEELKYSSENGIFIQTESLFYLTGIFNKYEETPEKALEFSGKLVEKYPDNNFYRIMHTEALMRSGNYREGEEQSYILWKTGDPYWQAASSVFYGMLNENHKKDYKKAAKFYEQAVLFYNKTDAIEKDHLPFAYAGLARAADREGDKEKAVDYYEKCLKITDYISLQEEAKAYIREND